LHRCSLDYRRPEETLLLVQVPVVRQVLMVALERDLPETEEVQEVLVRPIPVVQGVLEVPETAEVLALQLQHWV
jgi:hypothetical protein